MLKNVENFGGLRERRRIYIVLAIIVAVMLIFFGIKKMYFTRAPLPVFRPIASPLQLFTKAMIMNDLGNVELQLELADSPAKREQGLMFRESLAKDSGMLFIFDTDTSGAFWMKNTLIPLDMLFVDANKKIVDLATMVPCRIDPCPLYQSRAPYRYSIEVNQGFIGEHALKIGDTLEFE